jgi:hypothetical protein
MTNSAHKRRRWHGLPLHGPKTTEVTPRQWTAPGLRRPAIPDAAEEEFRVVALRTVGPAIYAPSWTPTVRIVIIGLLLVVIIVLTHPASTICMP